jgi:hypothetical protein
MANKHSNKNLGIVFALLLLIVVLIFVFGGESERTLRENLVELDTAKVDKVLIQPSKGPANMVKLIKKEDGQWKVELSEGKMAPVPKKKMENLFNQLSSIKPKSLAARDQNKWGEYQVDSTATIVKVYEAGDKALDLHVGRFNFQQPRMMSTYVRLAEDVNIYEVEGYLAPTFNKAVDSWRDGRLIKTQKEKWESLIFDYPADSSFTMKKIGGEWNVFGTQVDSAETAKYLRNLSRLNSSNFLSNLNRDALSNPTHHLTINTSDGESIEIKGYKQGSGYAITSSQNQEAIFDGSKNKLRSKIFVGMNSLLP